jgi:hypothetical protein
MNTLWSRAGAALIGCATVTLAAQSPAPQSSAASSGRRFVAIGCVSRTGAATAGSKRSNYVLTDTRGEPPLPPLRYRLDGDESTLSLHVGHTVEVSGPLTAGGGGSGPAALPVLKVSALTYISKSCPAPRASR